MTYSKYFKIPAFVFAAVTLAGCVDPKNFESDPVEVSTEFGVVTCQLYTKESVTWDRAIDRPETMSVNAADAVCRAEGGRRKGY